MPTAINSQIQMTQSVEISNELIALLEQQVSLFFCCDAAKNTTMASCDTPASMKCYTHTKTRSAHQKIIRHGNYKKHGAQLMEDAIQKC